MGGCCSTLTKARALEEALQIQRFLSV
uniref:Uncharacterized protein n=1 Tax=Vitis vinifera TaxID=29760 RepID=F6HI25_VITVI